MGQPKHPLYWIYSGLILLYCLPCLEYVQDPQSGRLWEDVSAAVAQIVRMQPENFRVTEEMIASNFGSIVALAREGGYPFPELKWMQDQVQWLFEEVPDSPIGWICFYPHNASAPRIALEAVGGFDEEMLHSEGWDLAYRLMQNGHKVCFGANAHSYHLYHHHDFFSPQNAFVESQKRRRAIAYMAEKNGDSKLHLIEFWLAALWPDRFIPEEMCLNSLMAFHHTYQNISSSEMAERVLMLNLHPLRSEGFKMASHVEGDVEAKTTKLP